MFLLPRNELGWPSNEKPAVEAYCEPLAGRCSAVDISERFLFLVVEGRVEQRCLSSDYGVLRTFTGFTQAVTNCQFRLGLIGRASTNPHGCS